MTNLNPKIVFFGTPQLATPTLRALIDNNLKPVLVITQPDKPVNRSSELIASPVKQLALDNSIEVLQPANKQELSDIFNELEVDLGVLVAYGMIIPEAILSKPKHGILNLHPSLLPKYRGPSPIQTTLLNNDKLTGVSIIKLTSLMDAGPIVFQEKINIEDDDNAQSLSDKLFNLGAEMIVKILWRYLGGEIKPAIQDESAVSMTKLIDRDDGKVNWQKKATEIISQDKAFYPWPGIFSYLDNKRLKIVNLGLLEGDFSPNLVPGELFLGPNKGLAIKCSQGAIQLTSVQLEGKKEMSGQDFLRGQTDLIGKKLIS